MPNGHPAGLGELAAIGRGLQHAQFLLDLLLAIAVDDPALALAVAVVAQADATNPLTISPLVHAAFSAPSSLACHRWLSFLLCANPLLDLRRFRPEFFGDVLDRLAFVVQQSRSLLALVILLDPTVR